MIKNKIQELSVERFQKLLLALLEMGQVQLKTRSYIQSRLEIDRIRMTLVT